MIVIDTNVWSETTKPNPSPAVLSWLARHAAEAAIASVTVAELRYGLARLPEGRRRRHLVEQVDRMLAAVGERLLAFDGPAAERFAELRAEGDAAGTPLTRIEDDMIAAICLVNSAAVATRNVSHFQRFGVEIINPWVDD